MYLILRRAAEARRHNNANITLGRSILLARACSLCHPRYAGAITMRISPRCRRPPRECEERASRSFARLVFLLSGTIFAAFLRAPCLVSSFTPRYLFGYPSVRESGNRTQRREDLSERAWIAFIIMCDVRSFIIFTC